MEPDPKKEDRKKLTGLSIGRRRAKYVVTDDTQDILKHLEEVNFDNAEATKELKAQLNGKGQRILYQMAEKKPMTPGLRSP